LTVEVDPQGVETALRQTTKRLSQRVQIPGFRRGRAPHNLIVRRFGQEVLLEETIDREGQNWYEKALDETDLEPYGQAEMEIASFSPLVMTFTLPVAPVVDLEDYLDFRLDWEPPQVSDEDEEQELARLQQESATLEPTERPAEMEDVATLDIKGHIGDEVVVDVEQRVVTLNQTVHYPVAGFAKEIVGMSPGEDREFVLTYSQDHANTAWAGKEAHFKVHMHSLKTWVLPELDDELARTVGNYETLDEWRADVREELEAKSLEEAEQDYANAVVDALVDQAHIEYPAVMLERELDSMMEDADQSLQQRGLGLENYLVMTGQSWEEYRESMRKRADKRLRRGLVLTELIKAEELEVTEDEVGAEIDRMAEALGDEADRFRQAFDDEKMRESVLNSLLTRAAVDRLKAIARGEYKPQVTDEPQEEEKEESTAAPEAVPAEMAGQAVIENTGETGEDTPRDDALEPDG
jgi:trigger factor